MQVWQEQTAELPASPILALLHSQTSVHLLSPAPLHPPAVVTHEARAVRAAGPGVGGQQRVRHLQQSPTDLLGTTWPHLALPGGHDEAVAAVVLLAALVQAVHGGLAGVAGAAPVPVVVEGHHGEEAAPGLNTK